MRKKLQVKPLPKNRKVSGPREPVAKNYKLVALNAKNCRIGQDHHNATLSDHEVDLVVALHEEGMTYVTLAEKFGVHPETIGKWCRGTFRGQAAVRFKKTPVG